MEKKVTFNKRLNDDNKEILDRVTIETKFDNYNSEKQTIKSVFHYRIDKSSGICGGNEDGYATITLNHENPIDYDDWHKNIVPLDNAMIVLGYGYDWRDKWENIHKDELFYEKLSRIIEFYIPITEEEYRDVFKDENNMLNN